MYTGNENLSHDGKDLPITMLHFWQWAYSNIIHNMQRGTFAHFIVKCALDAGHIPTCQEIGTGLEPYDLEGPPIPSTGNPARIEVKSAAFVQIWEIRHPDHANFSIAPAKVPDETGDYRNYAPRQRNNDLYVFTVYTATKRDQNILDLSLWEFYVLPTYRIETDPKLRKQKTISLKSVQKLCTPVSFNNLCATIIEACQNIPASFSRYTIYPDGHAE